MPETATKLTLGDVRRQLEELLKATAEYALAQERMHCLAEKIAERDGDVLEDALLELDRFSAAVRAQIEAACHDATHPEEIPDPLHICQEIQDAIDVLAFAIERDSRKAADAR